MVAAAIPTLWPLRLLIDEAVPSLLACVTCPVASCPFIPVLPGAVYRAKLAHVARCKFVSNAIAVQTTIQRAILLPGSVLQPIVAAALL